MPPKEIKVIGFRGLGKMGMPIAKRLIQVGGYKLKIYTSEKAKAEEMARLGAVVVSSNEELGVGVDAVISSIPGDRELIETYLGEKGILRSIEPGSTIIEMSTVTPSASRKVADEAARRGVYYLRTPISGSTLFAERGELTIYVSGDRAAYENALPVLRNIGSKILYVGSGEEARYLKLLINIIIATTPVIVAEALTIGEKAGIDWKTLIDALGSSAVASPQIGYKLKTLLEKDYSKPAFTVKQMIKDLDYALEVGKELGVFMPLTSLVRQIFEALDKSGKGDLDYFATLKLIEELSGVT
ncbi:MAG TPA: NAD(P)-dependent oxidoreductase [Sulfolobales archaeon]|nr:NAD(P)-dependent oxidoreductase [Sulfolobales archaeon]